VKWRKTHLGTDEESMRHDRRTDDTDRNVDSSALDNAVTRDVTVEDVSPVRTDFDEEGDEAAENGKDQETDEELEAAH
jgi:hypothetical protein